MATVFNANEILAMAEQIERNGRAFYLRAAEATSGKTHELLSDLAEWEKGHEALFSSMRQELSDEDGNAPLVDPGGDMELYLTATADTHVFNASTSPADMLAGDETPEQIIQTALGFERDSILLFVGMSKVVPERLGRDRVKRVIDEEMAHVAHLKRTLLDLQNKK